MSRKDYTAIAVRMVLCKPASTGEMFDCPAMETWEKIVEALAYVFAQDNPRFSPAKFYAACNYSR